MAVDNDHGFAALKYTAVLGMSLRLPSMRCITLYRVFSFALRLKINETTFIIIGLQEFKRLDEFISTLFLNNILPSVNIPNYGFI